MATAIEDRKLIQVNKIRLNSKVAALDSLARILGMFKADNEQAKD